MSSQAQSSGKRSAQGFLLPEMREGKHAAGCRPQRRTPIVGRDDLRGLPRECSLIQLSPRTIGSGTHLDPSSCQARFSPHLFGESENDFRIARNAHGHVGRSRRHHAGRRLIHVAAAGSSRLRAGCRQHGTHQRLCGASCYPGLCAGQRITPKAGRGRAGRPAPPSAHGGGFRPRRKLAIAARRSRRL